MKYTHFFPRAGALLIDFFILTIITGIVYMIFPALSIVVHFFYVTFFLSSKMQGTPGKAMMGITITTLDGQRISYQTSVIRYLASLISGAIFCIGYVFYFFTEKKQTLHDLVAGTIAVDSDTVQASEWGPALKEEVQRLIRWDETGPAPQSTEEKKFSSDNLQALEKLHELFQKGVLTEAEYIEQKQRLLK